MSDFQDTQRLDQRIAVHIRQWEDRMRAEKNPKVKHAPKIAWPVETESVIQEGTRPIDGSEKFALCVSILGAVNAGASHFLGWDPALRYLGNDGAHVFWAVVILSSIYVLGIFRDFLKPTWRIEERPTGRPKRRTTKNAMFEP